VKLSIRVVFVMCRNLVIFSFIKQFLFIGPVTREGGIDKSNTPTPLSMPTAAWTPQTCPVLQYQDTEVWSCFSILEAIQIRTCMQSTLSVVLA